MGNGAVQAIGKLSVATGLICIMYGLALFISANTGLCSGPINGAGCTTNYSPLILPALIGGALIVEGACVFWVFKPQASTMPDVTNRPGKR